MASDAPRERGPGPSLLADEVEPASAMHQMVLDCLDGAGRSGATPLLLGVAVLALLAAAAAHRRRRGEGPFYSPLPSAA